MPTENISWLVVVAVKPGELDRVTQLMHEMVAAAEPDPGTLLYEWFVSDDRSLVHIYERYADDAATLAHLRLFAENFAGRYGELVDQRHWWIYGSPGDEVRKIVTGFGAEILQPLGGFARE